MPPWGKKHEPPLNPIPLPPSTRALCCGSSDFIIGALTYAVRHEPSTGFYERTESGCIVACAHCGRKLAINAQGVYIPHEEALPGPWALEQVRKRGDETKALPNRVRSSFRKPPRDE